MKAIRIPKKKSEKKTFWVVCKFSFNSVNLVTARGGKGIDITYQKLTTIKDKVLHSSFQTGRILYQKGHIFNHGNKIKIELNLNELHELNQLQ